MKKYMTAYNALYGTISEGDLKVLGTSRSSNLSKPRKPRRHIEDGMQIRLVEWAISRELPIFSIPNEGNRGRLATHRLKEMGLRPGAADLFLARRSFCGKYGGYFIELKSPGERPRLNQLQFLQDMLSEGYLASWFDDWLKARQSIASYLGLKENER